MMRSKDEEEEEEEEEEEDAGKRITVLVPMIRYAWSCAESCIVPEAPHKVLTARCHKSERGAASTGQ